MTSDQLCSYKEIFFCADPSCGGRNGTSPFRFGLPEIGGAAKRQEYPYDPCLLRSHLLKLLRPIGFASM